jgi:pyridoxal phosphate enzyme (YggS family)
VSLVAVSKTHDAEQVEEAISAGQLVFGEYRVQEAKAKFPALKDRHAGLQLHLIGPLQTNKVRDAVAMFDVIQTLDRASLAEALSAELAKTGRSPKLYVQVNTGEEPQKAGILPHELMDFLAECRTTYNLEISGLMCIPPVDEEPSPHFALLGKYARAAGVHELSMGMSSDFETAVTLGATCVRVGSAIFGERPKLSPEA